MADNSRMIRQPNILRVITPSTDRTIWAPRILINNECAFHIDLDRARMYDRTVNLSSIGAHAQGFRGRDGGARRGILDLIKRELFWLRDIRRHGGYGSGAYAREIEGLRRHQRVAWVIYESSYVGVVL
jgi:hypothetical protein